MRANYLLAVTRAYVFRALASELAIRHCFNQPFAGLVNRQHVSIGLVCAPLALAVVPNIRQIGLWQRRQDVAAAQ